jgi:hypothetical protein
LPDAERRYRVEFADETKKELRDLGHAAAVEILSAVDKKLTVDPEDTETRSARICRVTSSSLWASGG